MRMPEATLPLQWDLFKIADGHIQYRLVVDGSNRSIRFTVSDNNKYEIIRAEDRFQKSFFFLDFDIGPDDGRSHFSSNVREGCYHDA